MTPGSDLYEEVAEVYRRLIGRASGNAAASIAEIHCIAGPQTAVQAALIITRLKIEVQQERPVSDLKIYSDWFQNYSEARFLLEEAIAVCLRAWGIRDIQVQFQNGTSPQLIC